ncbi:MAG: putative toxin-antitoxin system toxin component, PIN family [Acidobacteriaceae bacterium]|nr:putative toxin-antitoxin system toxin component, PIN family [Acidobacteriaceae bacterium]
MLRVVAATNIYISALNFGGAPERLLRLAEAGDIQLVISNEIVEEVAKTLRGEKFAWPEPEIEKALRQLSRITERVQPTHRLDIITADPADNRILECADAERADYIISGDTRHILPLGQHGRIPIMKVADFLRQLQGDVSKQR